MPLRARVVALEQEDHYDNRAVNPLCWRIISPPGFSEVIKFRYCSFGRDAGAVDERLIPDPGVMRTTIPDFVERGYPGRKGLPFKVRMNSGGDRVFVLVINVGDDVSQIAPIPSSRLNPDRRSSGICRSKVLGELLL